MNSTPHPLLEHSNQDSWNGWNVRQILQNAYTFLLGKPKQKKTTWETYAKMGAQY